MTICKEMNERKTNGLQTINVDGGATVRKERGNKMKRRHGR